MLEILRSPFMRTAYRGALISISVGILTTSMLLWAPSVLFYLEMIGHHQLKPWIYFLPSLIALAIFAWKKPEYHSKQAVLALYFGGTIMIGLGGSLILLLAALAIPNMRY